MNVQTVSFQGLSFINVAKPTDFEMKYLKSTYYFNPLNLEDYVHRTQIPKIENHKKYNHPVRAALHQFDSPGGKEAEIVGFKSGLEIIVREMKEGREGMKTHG